jgi:putative endonuclease
LPASAEEWAEQAISPHSLPVHISLYAGRAVTINRSGFRFIPATLERLLARHSREGGNPVLDFVDAAMKQSCVYILASEKHGTLYIGVTSDIVKRIWEHKNDAVEGFTEKYGVHRLVWFEQHETMESAIQREKTLKKWRRDWKLNLIESINPEWRDLYVDLI